jgi:hypothetical protein
MQGWFSRGITPFPFCGESEAVEERDGIGGEMVLSKKWQAAASRPRGTETQAKADNPGKAKLIAAMDKHVGEQSDEIAKKLIEGFLAGNVTSIKLLFELADGHINCENVAVIRTLYSYAQKLETEQQLAADASDAMAESDLDKSEPEG